MKSDETATKTTNQEDAMNLTGDMLMNWMEEAQVAVNDALEIGKPFYGSMNYADRLVEDRGSVEWNLRERLFAACLIGREVVVDSQGFNVRQEA